MRKFLENNWQIILILLLALALRLPLLSGSFWLDEAAQALEIVRPTSQQLNLVKDFQPPLLHLILHFSYLITHNRSEWFLRLVGALIPGLITIWTSYKVADKLINKKAGILTALLLATNSFHIFYSQELRPYSLPAMLGALSWLLLINFKNNFIFYFLFFFLSSLGLYSSYLYPFLILSQIIYVLLINHKIVRPVFYSLFFSLLSFLPWLPKFLEQLKVGTNWQTQLPGWSNVVSITQLKVLPLILGKFLYGVTDLQLNVKFFLLTFFILFLLVVISLPILKQIKKTRLLFINHKSLVILLIWLIIPLLSSWLISFIIPILRPKRVLYLLPAFYLFISYLLSYHKKNLLTILTIAILLSTNLISTLAYYHNPQYQREDWRGLRQEIYDKFDSQNTLVVFSFDEPFAPWIWYEQNNNQVLSSKFQTLATGKLYINNIKNLDNNLEIAKNYQTLLVFDYLRDLTDPDDKLLEAVRNKGFIDVANLDQENIGFVRVLININ